MSGINSANLGDSYFSNRMDIYLAVEKSKELADHLEAMTSVASAINCSETDPLQYERMAVNMFSRYSEESLNSEISKISLSTSRLFSVGQNELDLESEIAKLGKIKFALLMSSYLNLTGSFKTMLSKYLKCTPLRIITSSSETNGFHSAKGLARLIPKIYEYGKHSFMLATNDRFPLERNMAGRETIYSYMKPGWTYHAKGIFFETDSQAKFIFGSSNFGIIYLVRYF